ncbi:VQ motif-containing protein 25-like [Camellia sinensis]|nr:VQ motif-containing protein 25-like [Camellia sinensis]
MLFTMVEEIMLKKQTCVPSSTTSASALGMHKDSQIISKVKPKIRIIHIFAPEIIKTDVENFRELVQRLTGKPTEEANNTNKKPRIPRKEVIHKPLRTGFRFSEFRERIKGEDEMWGGGENPNTGGGGGGGSGGFLGGFADLDGFMQQLNEYPLLPLDASSQMDALGETQLA